MARIKTGKIFNVGNMELGFRTSKGSHDVVVVRKQPFSGKVLVKTITSLENLRNGALQPDLKALALAKAGMICPIPVPDLQSSHWSGIFNQKHEVAVNDLRKARICSAKEIPKEYWKILKK